MNLKTPTTARQSYRWKNGALRSCEVQGREGLSAAGHAGGLRGMSVYGDSPERRRQRASDLARKRALSAADWQRLLTTREKSYGLAPGTLTGALPATQPPRRRGRPPLSLAARLGREGQRQTG